MERGGDSCKLTFFDVYLSLRRRNGKAKKKRREERKGSLAGLYVHNPLVLNWRIALSRSRAAGAWYAWWKII
jgi:hypothetical protein